MFVWDVLFSYYKISSELLYTFTLTKQFLLSIADEHNGMWRERERVGSSRIMLHSNKSQVCKVQGKKK